MQPSIKNDNNKTEPCHIGDLREKLHGGNFYLNILSKVCWIITAAALKGKAGENDKSYKEIRFNWIRTMASM